MLQSRSTGKHMYSPESSIGQFSCVANKLQNCNLLTPMYANMRTIIRLDSSAQVFEATVRVPLKLNLGTRLEVIDCDSC